MLSNPSSPRRYATSFSVSLITIAVVLAAALTVFAQTTISTGSIQGTVTDPSGAVVSGATVIRPQGKASVPQPVRQALTRRAPFFLVNTSCEWKGKGSRLRNCRSLCKSA